MTDPITISFCTTCKNRLYQLRETLPGNLEAIGAGEEIVLVDYDSPDGLAKWVWDNFREAIEAGRLRFFRVTDTAPWHVSKAKNLAYRLSRGEYLFNLDGDNFLTASDLEKIHEASAAGTGCRQKTENLTDGTPGRIGMARRIFFELGGYDEGLLGVILEDFDLVTRAEMIGYAFRQLGAPERLPVQNNVRERLGTYAPEKTPGRAELGKLWMTNLAVAELRRELEGPRRHQNFASFRGRLNGQPVIVDGAGFIRADHTVANTQP
ncbi:glycosyltransferase family 2 protein [Alteraurantiacibacter aquimixticola]|nr:glycosyltransferase family A protein [Alteraurantiacibacter aquimixticola]